LMAIALMAALMASAVAILFQVSSAWASQAEDPALDRHVDGVDRFVRRLLAESGGALTVPTSEQIAGEHAILAVRPMSDLPWIALQSKSGGVLEGRLAAGADGKLLLFWNTRDERSQGSVEPHVLLISPWVESAKLYRLDPGAREWSEIAPGESMSKSPKALHALRIEFVHRGQRRPVQFLLPKTEGPP